MNTIKYYLKKQVFVLFFLWLFSTNVYAQNQAMGEIININYDLGIAFADFNNHEAKEDNIVQVKTNSGKEIYLKVIQISPILSKLGIISAGNYKTDTENFKEVIAGNPIIGLIDEGSEHKDKAESISETIPNHSNSPQVNFENQFKDLKAAYDLQQNKLLELQSENKMLKKQISDMDISSQLLAKEKNDNEQEIGNLKSRIKILKENLEKMSALIQLQNNS